MEYLVREAERLYKHMAWLVLGGAAFLALHLIFLLPRWHRLSEEWAIINATVIMVVVAGCFILQPQWRAKKLLDDLRDELIIRSFFVGPSEASRVLQELAIETKGYSDAVGVSLSRLPDAKDSADYDRILARKEEMEALFRHMQLKFHETAAILKRRGYEVREKDGKIAFTVYVPGDKFNKPPLQAGDADK